MKRVLCIFLKNIPENCSPAQRDALFSKLSCWAYQFSPIVASDTAVDHLPSKLFWGLNLDITGCERLFGGLPNLLQKIARDLANFHFIPSLAIAPTLGAAWAFSRYGSGSTSVVSQTNLRQALGSLPVQALRLEDKLCRSLEDVNITHIEHLLSIPKKSLVSRFGAELLTRLNQALGTQEEPLRPATLPFELRAEKIFSGLVLDSAVIQKSAYLLLQQLVDTLTKKGQRAAHVLIDCKTIDMPLQTKAIILSIPSGDFGHLRTLVNTQLEKISLGSGVESLTLRVHKTAPIAAEQIAALERTEDSLPLPASPQALKKSSSEKELGKLLDLLSDHLGPEEVFQAECRQSYFPEKSFRFHPFGKKPKTEFSLDLLQKERPSLLFSRPSPAEVIAGLPDNAPASLKWHQKRYRIKQGIGPERIAPEWWGEDPQLLKTRDYFKIQLSSGAWLWVFRQLETGRWFIHGVWC